MATKRRNADNQRCKNKQCAHSAGGARGNHHRSSQLPHTIVTTRTSYRYRPLTLSIHSFFPNKFKFWRNKQIKRVLESSKISSPTHQVMDRIESQNDLSMVNPSKMAQVSVLAVPGHASLAPARHIALHKHERPHR